MNMKCSRFFVVLFLSFFSFSGLVKAQTADPASSRTVEDGGTGPFKALMVQETSLPTHTVFRPKDLSGFSSKNKLPIIVFNIHEPGAFTAVMQGEGKFTTVVDH